MDKIIFSPSFLSADFARIADELADIKKPAPMDPPGCDGWDLCAEYHPLAHQL